MQLLKVYDNEKEYRSDSEAYNYSKIKDFDSKSLLGFRKKYILGDDSDDDKLDINFGRLVHAKLAEDEQLFDETYYISDIYEKPKPQEVRFVDELFKLTLKDTDKDGVYQGDFGEMCQEAYNLAEIKTPLYPKFISNFENSPAEKYYQELRKSNGKKVTTIKELELCEKVIRKAKESPTVGEIILWRDRKNEIPIKFEYEGYVFRVLLDRMNFDHVNKKVSRWDWKITYAVDEKEFGYNYFDMKYYIQQFLYNIGSRAYIEAMYPGYEIEPFKYVAIESKGLYDSVVHEFEFGWETPWTGFTHKGRRYKGIPEIIESMNWHINNNVWSMRKDTYLNKGYCKHLIGE